MMGVCDLCSLFIIGTDKRVSVMMAENAGA